MAHYPESETSLRESKALTLYVLLARDPHDFCKEMWASDDKPMLRLLLDILLAHNTGHDKQTKGLNAYGAGMVRRRLAALIPVAIS